MLTIIKKALILNQAGFALPLFPGFDPLSPQRPLKNDSLVALRQSKSDLSHDQAVKRWNQEIEILFVYYVAARAAKSLRESEQARQISMLRQANEK